ncbi:hypothetical protein [Sulfitobacter sp. D7]|jgi:hypothetical protein|uniref:hypothetical protein n=1 Tax=Sulfitobacter sp. D7 TaxID=1968541 RepID=UPI000E776726|nr:hypothetical protein [Sulfitobacter sp. D7]AYE85385.1 hypothetical protein B5M07_04210 [Sulfitobacter sp. D7]
MTGTDKSAFNPGGGDRPSYMPGGDYFEPKALSDALPQVMSTVLKVVHTQPSRKETQPQDGYIDCWADMEINLVGTPGNE